ncbi:acetate--CoA ligase [candidate division CPR3 bacterium 4484_211]|uniref:Acetate--CoA ligase n=1 Tax=candidate division CPR3 bacterium 4484_211 TaxID=1968527 RepID=A0A1W9NZI6_UNCC3|nr:MAG: acetate--CoA ligase [candidate division CPR3 bacterium 4484_211]
MNKEIIKKTKDLLKKEPNLKNYASVYKAFEWRKAYHELDWFPNNRINAAHNAIDRHAQGDRKSKVALFWEGEKGEKKKYTFLELMELSNKFANVLRKLGVERGDRVFFFLPRVPELYYGFLGTLKTGAIAGTLFSAFGEKALLDRLQNSAAKILVTNKELKKRLDKIRDKLPRLEKVLLIDSEENTPKSVSLPKAMAKASEEFRTAHMKPTEPAFMLYTSGTTGKPKGVIHQHLAILHEHMSAKWVLDIHEDDIYWCTADPGWVTGIAYEILGTWSNGAATVVYQGRFNPEKWYEILQEYDVTVWYTAPTAVRMLIAAGDELPKKFDLRQLRHLCSVGEPLNPEGVWWGLKVFGIPFHDNWWQTETGGILIANYPSMDIKPGSMGKPLPGIKAAIVDDKGKVLPPMQEGNLAIKPGWPSMMQKIWRRPQKYESYFVNNWYISGDRAYMDKDGYFWFIGRADDVIKTSGERVGPFEVESALVEHPSIIEAGVIGKPDPMRGEIIKAFVILKEGERGTEELKENIKKFVKKHLAGHAYPREIEFVKFLPKTRSGKIVRRFLKAKEMGLPIGDTSTLVK